MEPVIVVLVTFVLLAAVVRFVGAPLRAAARGRGAGRANGAGEPGAWLAAEEVMAQADADAEAEREALEAAREAKYREIRDAELDFRTGKLSAADYDAIDASLRAEAIEILDRLEPVAGEPGTGSEQRGAG